MEMLELDDDPSMAPDHSLPVTAAEFKALWSQGFYDEQRVELLFGRVYAMTPPEPPHSASANIVRRMIERALGDRAEVLSDADFEASDISMPVPDVLVVPLGRNAWKEHPKQARLIIEVAHTSHYRDRVTKRRLYALANVEEYWIIDIPKGRVEVYRDSEGDDWKTKTTHSRGETISPRAFPDVVIPVSEIVPPLEG